MPISFNKGKVKKTRERTKRRQPRLRKVAKPARKPQLSNDSYASISMIPNYGQAFSNYQTIRLHAYEH